LNVLPHRTQCSFKRWAVSCRNRLDRQSIISVSFIVCGLCLIIIHLVLRRGLIDVFRPPLSICYFYQHGLVPFQWR
jgi:hypothetical protein